ncbi:MAG: hypothetical protein O3A25_13095 [Acidobacteria bacterium]|nr:hypothetical protein [Acidobacteriota bacterium]
MADYTSERRTADRVPIAVSGRLSWTDANGAARSAEIRTENVSARGLLVDCLSSANLPMHRLVGVSLSTGDRAVKALPRSLRNRHAPAAIARIQPPRDPNRASCRYALRLLAELD